MGRVEDKIAIVTGAASGIGRATAVLLAAEGARVVACDVNRAGLDETVDQIGANGPNGPNGSGARAVVLDVRDEAAWRALMADVAEREGGLQILVNAAGVLGRSMEVNPEEVTLEDFRAVNAINLEGVLLGCKHGVGAIRDGGGGAIVNISSIAAILATPQLVPYGAGKAAVSQLTKSYAIHGARHGRVRCNSIHPGIIATQMGEEAIVLNRRDPAKARERTIRSIPLGHMGEPEDVAWTALFLASDEAKYITGAEFFVDGGLTVI